MPIIGPLYADDLHVVAGVIIFFWLANNGQTNRVENTESKQANNTSVLTVGDQFDSLFIDTARLVIEHQTGSVSFIQRKLIIGYNRAGRLLDQLELAGIVGPQKGNLSRDVKIQDPLELEKLLLTINDPLEFHDEETISVSNTLNQKEKISDFYNFLEGIYQGQDCKSSA